MQSRPRRVLRIVRPADRVPALSGEGAARGLARSADRTRGGGAWRV